jgi:hypothetical protein
MQVVEHFELVLDAEPSAEREQIEVVLQLIAQVRVRVGDAELVARPAGHEGVAAETHVEERRDRTRALIGKGDLSEQSPSILGGALDDGLSEGVIDRP